MGIYLLYKEVWGGDSAKSLEVLIFDFAVFSKVAGVSGKRDVSRAKLKGTKEFSEYGDASSAVQPNVFAQYGVFEEDLCTLYPKNEVSINTLHLFLKIVRSLMLLENEILHY